MQKATGFGLLGMAVLLVAVWYATSSMRSSPETPSVREVMLKQYESPRAKTKSVKPFEKLYEDLVFQHPGDRVFQGSADKTKRLLKGYNQLTRSPDPNHRVKSWIFLGQQALRDGAYETALTYFTDAYFADDVSDDIRMEAGIQRIQALHLLERGDEALRALDQMTEEFLQASLSETEETNARKKLAEAAIRMNELDRAHAVLDPLIQSGSKVGQNQAERMAKHYLNAGQLSKASDVLASALSEGGPRFHVSGKLYKQWVDTLYRMGDFEGAQLAREMALLDLTDPQFANIALQLADVVKKHDLGTWYDELQVLSESDDAQLRTGALERLADYALLRRDFEGATELWGELLAEDDRGLNRRQKDYLKSLEAHFRAGDDVTPMVNEITDFLETAEMISADMGLLFGSALERLELMETAGLAYERAAEFGLGSRSGNEAHRRWGESLVSQGEARLGAVAFQDAMGHHLVRNDWVAHTWAIVGMQTAMENIDGFADDAASLDASIMESMRKVRDVKQTIFMAQSLQRQGYDDWAETGLEIAKERFNAQAPNMDPARRFAMAEEIARAFGIERDHATVIEVASRALEENTLAPSVMQPAELTRYLGLSYNLGRSLTFSGQRDAGRERINEVLAVMDQQNTHRSSFLTNIATMNHSREPEHSRELFRAAIATGDTNPYVQVARTYLGANEYELENYESALNYGEMIVAFSNPLAELGWQQRTNRSGHYLIGLSESALGADVNPEALLEEGSVWSVIRRQGN